MVVTGANGHVGRYVQARVAGCPNEVRPLDRHGDLVPALADAEAVIHLAGTLQPRGGNTYREANVETVRRTVTALEGSSVRRVVLLSYVGANPGSANEYLRTKGEAERLVEACGREAVVLRSTFVVGPPHDPGPSAVPFVSDGGKPVSVIGTGRQLYAPVHVEDVAEALVRFAVDPETPTGTFALAGPETLRVDDFAGVLSRADVLAANSLPDVELAAPVLGLEPRSVSDAYGAAG